ncbi:hypothetical protein KVR01_011086 [Diaporthe batatas]|uniref:uncharacterized protein n=1 Tax=Diaporthe batatas TaxID=748121 RepID=UPI001D058814|nr:uncharacterized protein KVR01_011086 [Diaporthe batatas]KAG8159425.1 hypothetical protein KVR01_011086 [Diaporthe batatas]
MRRRNSGPVARRTRAQASPEFGQNDLGEFERRNRQKRAKGRKSALGRPKPGEDKQPSLDTTATTPARATSAAANQEQSSLDSDSVVDPPTTIPDADSDLVIERLPRRSLTPESASSCTETSSLYYERIGYLPPLSESTLEVIRKVLANPSMGSSAGRLVKEADQQNGLNKRNVNWNATTDPFRQEILLLQTQTGRQGESDDNRKWNDDLEKCRVDPQEFVFQRTLMMSMVDRHRLIYGSRGVLDFAVERPWNCSPMPTRAFLETDGKHLPKAKPDIAIAFRTTTLMDTGSFEYLPEPLQNIMCYEGKANAQQLRAFHFFMIESKNSWKTLLEPVSQYQALNGASQSLHNMYEFFNEAGPKHLAKFFDEVRVFTAVSTTEGIIIRVHRACLARNLRDKDSTIPVPKHPILPDYPLQFEYDIYHMIKSDDFTQGTVAAALETVMIQYGVEQLFKLLKDAADDVVKKFEAKREHRSKYYYSHGQIPKDPKTKAQPKNGQAGQESTSQSTSAASRTSRATPQSSSQGPAQEEFYPHIQNIEEMHKLNKESSSRSAQARSEHDSPTPTPTTPPRHIAGPDPNASLSENFGSGFHVDDSARSEAEQPGPAAAPSQSGALPPRHLGGKRRGVPGDEAAEGQTRAHFTRSKRSKNQHGPDSLLR